jgi:hypothetical protein
MSYEVSGTVYGVRGEQTVCVAFETLEGAQAAADGIRAAHGADADVSVWEHDTEREARERGAYAPALVG